MQPEARKFLYDMREACEAIKQFVRGKDLKSYKADRLLRSGVERQFQILGEALYQLSNRSPGTLASIPEHRSIIAFRHVLVHGYDKVDDEIVWGIILTKLDPLREALDGLLDS